MKIAIVDDEKTCRDQLAGYINDYVAETGEQIEILLFSSGLDFASDYKSDCDVIFLDIEMPHMDGISVAKEIRKVDEQASIIFVTNYSRFAINGYEVNALDYVIKPLTYFVFREKLKKALRFSRRNSERTITVTNEDRVIKIPVNKIFYITSEKNYVNYHTEDGEYKERGTIIQTKKKFDGLNFVNCTAGCIVNLMHVKKVVKNDVYVHDGVLPLSRPQHKEFMSKYIEYLSRGTC